MWRGGREEFQNSDISQFGDLGHINIMLHPRWAKICVCNGGSGNLKPKPITTHSMVFDCRTGCVRVEYINASSGVHIVPALYMVLAQKNIPSVPFISITGLPMKCYMAGLVSSG